MKDYILAIDQGTTSSRAIIFNRDTSIKGIGQVEFTQFFPEPGWVEHDPEEIFQSQVTAVRLALEHAKIKASQIRCCGITNQRETTIIWDRKTGKPLHKAIVWQCRRSSEICANYSDDVVKLAVERNGLVIDPYFSASKLVWLKQNTDVFNTELGKNNLCFGTVDSWLIHKFTQNHYTDLTNASRTLVCNIHEAAWDKDLLRSFALSESMLGEILPSCADYGVIPESFFGAPIPITGVLGDQHAALLGQRCFVPGEVKNTYGTGCFTLMYTGHEAMMSRNGLLTTVAWDLGKKGGISYALEGGVFTAGAVIQWLRDKLGLISEASQTDAAARSVDDTHGVTFVPAFSGLGAPWWQPEARGMISGLSRGVRREHIIRAALESIALQSYGLVKAMENDSGNNTPVLKVDGGASMNNFLMQFQADILQIPVERPAINETTALGAAFAAGLQAGIYRDIDEIATLPVQKTKYIPSMVSKKRDQVLEKWNSAVHTLLYSTGQK